MLASLHGIIASSRRPAAPPPPSREYVTLNGTDQRVTISGHSLSVAGVATFSLVCWFKLGTFGATRRILSLKSTTTSGSDSLQIIQASSGTSIIVARTNGTTTPGTFRRDTVGVAGDWICVALACNGNANEFGAVYIDGVLATDPSTASNGTGTTVAWELGARVGPDSFFNGGIGPVYAWNANLTGTQLAAFSTSAIGVIPSGLSIPTPDFSAELNGNYTATGGTLTPANSPTFATYP